MLCFGKTMEGSVSAVSKPNVASKSSVAKALAEIDTTHSLGPSSNLKMCVNNLLNCLLINI